MIWHGTDSMPETARTLGAVGLAKTIVLFGAAIPYVKPPSDALFNLDGASAVRSTCRMGSISR
ncbi:MAG: asparaginase domain-containing protein [Turneriella sp.]